MRPLLTLILLFAGSLLHAQPSNDACTAPIDLGQLPFCDESQVFTNLGASDSDIGSNNQPPCFQGTNPQHDVWFTFTTGGEATDYSMAVNGRIGGGGSLPIANPQVAVYQGDCTTDGLTLVACGAPTLGQDNVLLNTSALESNTTYFLRVSDFSQGGILNWGNFDLCITETSSVFTIDEGGSNACTGQLFDTGGPEGNYGNNENHVFTITPANPSGCITLTLDYYNIEETSLAPTDQIIIYDGPTADPNFIIREIGGADFAGGASGGGGVCLEAQAFSGSMTIQFISDGSQNFEGFQGHWQCSRAACPSPSPLLVQPNPSEEAIVQAVSGLQSSVKVVEVDCPGSALGTFRAMDDTGLGLANGLLLTTGTAEWAIGPNDDNGLGNPDSDNQAPGDEDLDFLSDLLGDGSVSFDACVVELDVFAATNELTFEYVFGSEEYPEFTEMFNDIFAFFISGPGIEGDPNLDGKVNIAVLPDGTPVQIGNVNQGDNWEYFRNNEGSPTLQYDGLTSDFVGRKKSLTARATVEPCNTYRIKLAIADRTDGTYDSGVFVADIQGGSPTVSTAFGEGIDYLTEGCESGVAATDSISIGLNGAPDRNITYRVRLGGTAERGIDFTTDLPDSVTFGAGQLSRRFAITPIDDGVVEGSETIIIELFNDFGCGEVSFGTLEIALREDIEVAILPERDTLSVCPNEGFQLEATGAESYIWTPSALFGDPGQASVTVRPTQDTLVFVEGSLGECTGRDSVFLRLVDPELEIIQEDTLICQGDSLILTARNNVDNQALTWSTISGPVATETENITVRPDTTTQYVATIDLSGCIVTDTVTLQVEPFAFPELAADTAVCQNSPVRLADSIGAPGMAYTWSPDAGLSDPNAPNPIALPTNSTSYTLMATSARGNCTQTGTINLEIFPANIELFEPQADSIALCLGDFDTLAAVINGGTPGDVRWSPSFEISDTSGLEVVIAPTASRTYFVTLTTADGCLVTDSVNVRVDSIPPSVITPDPVKEVYCRGDLVTLTSPTYETGDYPDIMHMWISGPGFETPDTAWNMVFTAIDSAFYERQTIIGGCVDTTSLFIPVVTPPEISITPADTAICAGESVELTLNYEGEGEIMWMPADGTVNPSEGSTVVTVTPMAGMEEVAVMATVEEMGCPTTASAQVEVQTPPPVIFNDEPFVCTGDSIQLNFGFSDDPAASYIWTTPSDPDFIATDPGLRVAPIQTTTYVLTTRVGDCPAEQQQITVEAVPPSTVNAPADQAICPGDTLRLRASGTAPANVPEFFVWNYNGQQLNGPNVVIGDITQSTFIELLYRYGPDGGACGTEQRIINVEVFDTNISIDSIVADPPSFLEEGVPEGSDITLTSFTSPAELPGGVTYTWLANGVPVGDNAGTLINAPLEDPTTYQLIIITENGCEIISEEITVNVVPPIFEIPNAFSPNGDGANDNFRVLIRGNIQIQDFVVYNRWGQVVYNNENGEEGWDGTHNGEPQPIDIYVYKVVLLRPDGSEINRSGELTLVR